MIQLFNLSETKKLLIPGNFQETIAFAARHWIDTAKKSIEDHGSFCVALSGGSTPKAIFECLAANYQHENVWNKTYVFWGDERAVFPTDTESNYKAAMDSGLSKLPLLPSHIFRMEAEAHIQEHAKAYEDLIKKTVPQCCFDLIMLGMGEDGHTASLFPATDALSETKRLVVANHILAKNSWRMTFTFPLINKAHHIVFYVTGASKKEPLNAVFHDTKALFPSSLVGTRKSPALWIVDHEAGELVVENLL